MTEIQGKSILVRVSARFEWARVRVIGSRLYKDIKKYMCFDISNCYRRIQSTNQYFQVMFLYHTKKLQQQPVCPNQRAVIVTFLEV